MAIYIVDNSSCPKSGATPMIGLMPYIPSLPGGSPWLTWLSHVTGATPGCRRPQPYTNLLEQSLATPIYSDNQSCLAIAQDPIGHRRTKHIDVRYHYIRELIAHGKATVSYLPTADMVADILTKPLAATVFNHCIQGLLTL